MQLAHPGSYPYHARGYTASNCTTNRGWLAHDHSYSRYNNADMMRKEKVKRDVIKD